MTNHTMPHRCDSRLRKLVLAELIKQRDCPTKQLSLGVFSDD